MRIKQLFGAVILSALIGTACSEDSNRTDRIVVLDSWWSLDYAKNSCEQATQWYRGSRDDIKQLGCDAVTACQENMPRVNACANDPGREVHQFFDQVAAQLASNTQCKGIQVVKYDGPNSATSAAMASQSADRGLHAWLTKTGLGAGVERWHLHGGRRRPERNRSQNLHHRHGRRRKIRKVSAAPFRVH